MSTHSGAAAQPGALQKLGVDIRRCPWIRRLVGEYAHDFARVASFYAGDPRDDAAWREAIARCRARPRPRAELADILEAQARRRNAPRAVLEAIAALRRPETVAIVTGQQAGLFGGPLYTLLKAITALQLARRVTREHATPAVAVFWIDAEDHDWAEVRSCGVLDGDLSLRVISLGDPPGAGELPVARVALDDSVERALADLAAALAPTEFTADLTAALGAAYRPGVGMAEAFARWMDALVGGEGLVVYEAADPSAKRAAAPVFVRELGDPGRTSALARAAGEALAARGHDPQVMPPPDQIALFHLDGARRPIRARGDHAAVGDELVPLEALRREAAERPERFSPNVLLRPIVQDALVPTGAYVAGPSELAYLGQLREVYAYFDVPMPLVYQRATATILDAAAVRFLTRYDLPLADLQLQDESALNRLLQSQLPPSVERALDEAREAIASRMAAVAEAVTAVDPTLAGAARTTRGRMEHDLGTLHAKIIQAAKKRHETLRRQFVRARAQAFPGGHPQERTVGVVYFVNRYGEALVPRLLAELPLEMGRHWVLTV